MLLVAGCSLALSYGSGVLENDALGCSNGLDDDLDGRIDCADVECAPLEVCREGSEISCGDARDNDLDGRVDCRDDGCVAAAVCQEGDEISCSDGRDNDQDEHVDCADTACAALAVCQEHDARACSDARDNDVDGKFDCLDEDCDGLCPEENLAFCTDGRDNDGDGVTDVHDPRCWPYRRVAADRCSSIDATDLDERFDDEVGYAERFYGVGGEAGIVGAEDGRPALLLARTDTADLTSVGTVGTFRGAFRGLDLSVLVEVLGRGSAIRIALAPVELAPVGAPRLVSGAGDITAVFLGDGDRVEFDGTAGETLTLPWAGTGWQRVTIREVDGALVATVAPLPGLGTGARAVFPPVPLGVLLDQATPAFRVVVDSTGYMFVRDLRMTLSGFDPCVVTVPQLPPDARVGLLDGVFSMGDAVSIARGQDALCAMVSGCERVGSGRQPTSRSYRSADDGTRWEAGERAFPVGIARSDGNRGFSVAWDPEAHLYRALAVAGTDASGALPLTTATSTDCRTWNPPTTLDLRFVPRDIAAQGCGALAAGLVRPSYVVRRASGAIRHEIYWTTTDHPRDTLTLVRAVSTDGVRFDAPVEVARFDVADLPGEPVVISVVGERDLVMTSVLSPRELRSGIAVRVAADDEGTRWTRIELDFGRSDTPGTFDRFQIVSGAIAPTTDGAVLLYGGGGDFRFDPFTQAAGGFSTGTARVRFSDLLTAPAL